MFSSNLCKARRLSVKAQTWQKKRSKCEKDLHTRLRETENIGKQNRPANKDLPIKKSSNAIQNSMHLLTFKHARGLVKNLLIMSEVCKKALIYRNGNPTPNNYITHLRYKKIE